MLKYILIITLIVSSLISSVMSHAVSSSVITNKSPNQLIGERDFGTITPKELDNLNCQITQNQYSQNLKLYKILAEETVAKINNGTIKLNMQQSKFQGILRTEQNERVDLIRINLNVLNGQLSAIDSHDCKKSTKIIQLHQSKHNKLIKLLKNSLIKATVKTTAEKDILEKLNYNSCQVDSDRMTARWNIIGRQQETKIVGWDNYLKKLAKDNSKVLDKSKLDIMLVEFSNFKEIYKKSYLESKEAWLNRKCSVNQKEDKFTLKELNQKMRETNLSFNKLKYVFQSIEI